MRVESVVLTEIRLPLKFVFQTSFGVTRERRAILVRLVGEGTEGVGECVAMQDAGYSYESVDIAWTALERLIVPRVVGKTFPTPAALAAALAPVRGHAMAKAAVEQALWDALARAWGMPLWQLLGGVRTRIPVGVSIGIQPSIEATLDAIARFLDEGYRRIKLKIQPGWDVALIEAVRERYPDVPLTVDANSAYSLADLPTFKALDRFQLGYIEQPLAYDDLHDHARLQAQLATPICLDESITSPADARKALASDAGRVINVKAGRVGGLLAARQVHDVAEAFGVPVWCGGMLETGVGRAFNLALSSLPNFTLPGDTSSSSRYWERDIVHEPLEAEDGLMEVPGGPGSGVTVAWDYVKTVTVREVRFP